MKRLGITLLTMLLLALSAGVGLAAAAADPLPRDLPLPQAASPELQKMIAAGPFPDWNRHPGTPAEWKAWVQGLAQGAAAGLPALRERYGLSVRPGRLAGVPVTKVTPGMLPAARAERLLLHFHGGGYVLNPGEAGTGEALLMAGIAGYRVFSVDYRMAPDFPYPAALDDALAVYRELLKSTPAEQIGVFGTSTGGGLTLALLLRARAEGLPLPGAIAPGTPWTDLSKTGDSYFTNAGVDNVLVSYEGWLGDAARLYAGGRDLKDPLLSPVYGDVSGFPPTLLTSGTRDLFLSNTVRMHLKLRQAGVPADLIVFEGLSHAQYAMSPDLPETVFHFRELGRFFDRYLK